MLLKLEVLVPLLLLSPLMLLLPPALAPALMQVGPELELKFVSAAVKLLQWWLVRILVLSVILKPPLDFPPLLLLAALAALV